MDSYKNGTIRLKHLSKSDDLINKKIDNTKKYKPEIKDIHQIIEYDNDNIINLYESVREASCKLNISEKSIWRYCCGKIGQFKDKNVKLKYLAPTDDLKNNKIDISTIPKFNRKIKETKPKSIAIYNKFNDQLIEIINDPDEITKKYNLSYPSIKKHCNGEIKYSKSIYNFKYVE